MTGKRGLSDDERAAWAAVTRKIKPLRAARKAAKDAASIAVSGPAPPPRKTAAIKSPVPKPIGVVAPAVPPLAALARREKQRVARGRDSIDARLDLHGHTQSEAHAALLRFLRRASGEEMKLVLVITGKSGVLRQQVPHWLALPEFRAFVISTSAAAINHGGDGAMYIRVRRGRG